MPCGSPAEFHVHAVHIAEHALREDVLDSALCVQLLFVQDDDLIRGGCEQGRWHINSIETFDDRLAIGNVNSALGNFLLPVYVDFMRAYPRISIHAAIGHSSDILQQLADGLIDVAISYRLPKSKKIRSWICVDEDFVFVVGRKDPLAEYESIHVKGLAITSLIMQDWGGAFSEWFHSIIPANPAAI